MTTNSKQELISKIVTLLNELIDVEEKSSMKNPKTEEKIEMLTIKECTELVNGLSEHTVVSLLNRIKFRMYVQDKAIVVRF